MSDCGRGSRRKAAATMPGVSSGGAAGPTSWGQLVCMSYCVPSGAWNHVYVMGSPLSHVAISLHVSSPPRAQTKSCSTEPGTSTPPVDTGTPDDSGLECSIPDAMNVVCPGTTFVSGSP